MTGCRGLGISLTRCYRPNNCECGPRYQMQIVVPISVQRVSWSTKRIIPLKRACAGPWIRFRRDIAAMVRDTRPREHTVWHTFSQMESHIQPQAQTYHTARCRMTWGPKHDQGRTERGVKGLLRTDRHHDRTSLM